MAQSMIMPKKYFFDKNGDPLAYGKVFTYQEGTTTPKATYTTSEGNIEATNPIILNGEGYAAIYLKGSYFIDVTDANGSPVWSEDGVKAEASDEWVNCQAPIYNSPVSFKLSGNQTEIYEEGRKVRVDNNTGAYSYSSINFSSFSGGETTVTLSTSSVQVGIIEVCVSITSEESSSLPAGTDQRYAPKFKTISDMTAANPVDSFGSAVNLVEGLIIGIEDYATGRNSGFIFGRVVASGTGVTDGGSYIDLANGLQFEQNFPSEVSAKHFDVAGNKVTNDTAGLASFFEYVAGNNCFIPDGQYLITGEGVSIKSGTNVRTSGATSRYLFFTNDNEQPLSYTGGVDFILSGTGNKKNRANNVSSMEAEGGVSIDPTTGLEYRLTNFSELFSAGVTVEHGPGTCIGPIRIIASYGADHYSEYNNPLNVSFSDNWDVGLFVDGGFDGYYDRLQIIGHYRKKGIFQNAAERPSSESWVAGSGERNKYNRCNVQSGISVRSNDRTQVTAFDAASVSIPYNPDEPYESTGGTIVLRASNDVRYSYTAAAKVGNDWKLSGLDGDPVVDGIAIGTEVRGSSIGNQGTAFNDCFVSGLDHQSGVRATSGTLSTPLANPSKILEVSGASSGSVRWHSCTFMSAEDCFLHAHDAANLYISLGFAESKAASDISGKGMRLITSAIEADSTATNPKGTTSNVQFVFTDTRGFVDMSPTFEETVTRFPAFSGLNRCQFIWDIEKMIDRSVGDKLRLKTSKVGDFQLASDATGIFDFRDQNGNRTLLVDPAADIFDYKNGAAESKFKVDGGNDITVIDTRVRPNSDGDKQLGFAGFRWSEIFAANGTINTSDARLKTKVRPFNENELLAAKILSKEIGVWQWLKEGSDRNHIGMTVQRAIQVMSECFLDPFDYGFICYDEWEDQYEYTEDLQPLDEGYELYSPGKWRKLIKKAGNVYSFRSSELDKFIMAGMSARLEALEG